MICSENEAPSVANSLDLQVLMFHHLKTLAGTSEIVLSIDGPLKMDELWILLLQKIPNLASCRDSTRMACNLSYVTTETVIYPGDEIALIPPVSGG